MISIVPYVRDVVHKKTKPNLITWATWTLLTGISSAAAFSASEYVTATVLGVDTLATGLVVLFGLRYGQAKYTLFDLVCQVCALFGLALWLMFDSPLIAVAISVAVDLVATLPTIRHSWLKPHEETARSYLICALSDSFGLFALATFNPISATYLVYNLLIDVTLAMVVRHRYKTNMKALAY